MAMRRSLKISLIAAAIIAAVITGSVIWVKNRPAPLPRTHVVKRQTVAQEVSFTGRLKSQQSVKLAFELSGKIIETPVKVGDKVSAGQMVARLDARLSELDLAQATASLSSASSEARVTWQNALNTLSKTKILNEETLQGQRQAVLDAKKALDQKKDYFDRVARESGDESSTTKSAHAAVLVAESAYNTAKSNYDEAVTTAGKTNDAALGSASLAEEQYLATLQASKSNPGLSVLEAAQAKASVTLSKSVMTAPFAGTVVSRPVDAYNYVMAGSEVLTLETTDALEVTADVPETDALKLAIGQRADITLDALPPTETWQTEVYDISPAAKILAGVPTYEIKLRLSGSDTKLKPGLTANIVVHADQKDNVIAVPRRAVITRSGKQIVQVLNANKEAVEKEVATGLVGSDGLVEITVGLNEGDAVLLKEQALKP